MSTSDNQQQTRRAVNDLIKAQDAFRAGDYQAALTLVDSSRTYSPDLPDASFLRGRILTKLGRYNEARAAYRAVVAVDPDYRGAWFNLANNAFRQQKFRTAVELYQKAEEKDPSAATSFYLGRAYAELGEAERAREAYLRSAERDSSYALAFGELSRLDEENGEFQSALENLHRAEALDPANPVYKYRRGSLLLKMGRAMEAVPVLEEVLRVRPQHQKAHYALGQALIRLGRKLEGKQYLSSADSLQEVQAKLTRLEALASMHPEEKAYWIRLGNELRRAGRYSRASEAYKVAVALAPYEISLRNNLASLLARRGELDAAVAHYRRILDQDSTVADVWFNLGLAYAQLGDEVKAQDAWRQVLRLDPGHSAASAYLRRMAN